MKKMRHTTNHPQTQYQQYLSFYWPDVDQSLKVSFWINHNIKNNNNNNNNNNHKNNNKNNNTKYISWPDFDQTLMLCFLYQEQQ